MLDQFFLPKPDLPESQDEILIEVTREDYPSGSLESLMSKAPSDGTRSCNPASVESSLYQGSVPCHKPP